MATDRHAVDALLGMVGAEIGTPLALDDDNECIVARDDGQEVILALGDDASALFVMAPLISSGHDRREELFAWLLEVNMEDELTRGTTIGLDRATDTLVLRYRLPLEGLSGVELAGLLSNLFTVIDEMTAAIVAERDALSGGEPEPPLPTPSDVKLQVPSPHDFA